jgi:hypothetical protein
MSNALSLSPELSDALREFLDKDALADRIDLIDTVRDNLVAQAADAESESERKQLIDMNYSLLQLKTDLRTLRQLQK